VPVTMSSSRIAFTRVCNKDSRVAVHRDRGFGTGAGPLPRLDFNLVIRIVLAGLFVFACYQLDWLFLRSAVTVCVLDISRRLGIDVVRISSDTLTLSGSPFRFVVACTQIDVFFGAIPLIWSLRVPAWENLVKLGTFFCCLSALNLIRLEFGFLLFAHAVPWFWAHEFPGGIALFLIFLWVVRQVRSHEIRRSETPSTAIAILKPPA